MGWVSRPCWLSQYSGCASSSVDRVPREEVGRHPALGGFLGDGLRAVLAELGQLAATGLLGPCAAGAVEPVPLVQPRQRRRRPHRTHLLQPALQRHHHGLYPGRFVLAGGDDGGSLVEGGVDIAVRFTAGGHDTNLVVDHARIRPGNPPLSVLDSEVDGPADAPRWRWAAANTRHLRVANTGTRILPVTCA